MKPIELNTIDLADKKTSLGPGIELLMNDKKKSRPNSPDIKVDDLNKLEKELNDLSNPKPSLKEAQSSIFSTDKLPSVSLDIKPLGSTKSVDTTDKNKPVKLNSTPSSEPLPTIKLTAPVENKTWDGFNKFNDIPINKIEEPKQKALSQEETVRQKFAILRKLERLEQKGVHLSKKYNMESSLLEMQGEYETHVSEKEKHNAIKFQGKMLMAAVTGLEFLNNRFDPFDLKLDGWGEQVNENIDDYDEIFGELHEKYKSKATLAPELKLLFQLGGSAIMLHMTNTMFKSAMPGMDDIMRQNPELMQQFTQAAVNHMGEHKPEFGNFMNDVIHDGAPPPPPVRTQGPGSVRPPPRRPDIGFARQPDMNEGIDIHNNKAHADPPLKTSRTVRADMKGPRETKRPGDINDLLSGLKSKTIQVEKPKNDSSTVSISELKDLENSNPPKKSRRRSDKNTVSLDI